MREPLRSQDAVIAANAANRSERGEDSERSTMMPPRKGTQWHYRPKPDMLSRSVCVSDGERIDARGVRARAPRPRWVRRPTPRPLGQNVCISANNADQKQTFLPHWFVVLLPTLLESEKNLTQVNAAVHAINNSGTGTRTRVARVRAEYPNQLDYTGVEIQSTRPSHVS